MDTIKGIATDTTCCRTSYLSKIRASDFNFEEDIIDLLLNRLGVSKVTGNDGIPAGFLKTLHSFFIKPLINGSLESGVVPQIWKLAPLQKKNNVSGLTNYRPISMLPTLSKMLERVVCHLLHHDLMSQYQSGFSTQDVLHRVTDSWFSSLDNHQCVGAYS